MIKAQEDLPLTSSFNGAAIQDIWDSCMAFKVGLTNGNKVYQCEYVGKSLVQAFGNDLKNRYFSSFDSNARLSREFMKYLDSAVEKKDFIVSEDMFMQKAKTIKYRDCIMPFKNMKGEIDYLVVGISWRAFN